MNDYLSPTEVRTLDLIHDARWCHTTTLNPAALHVLTLAGYLTVTDDWVRLTEAGWDLYKVAVA